jgi:hypothetical protein
MMVVDVVETGAYGIRVGEEDAIERAPRQWHDECAAMRALALKGVE